MYRPSLPDAPMMQTLCIFIPIPVNPLQAAHGMRTTNRDPGLLGRPVDYMRARQHLLTVIQLPLIVAPVP